MLLNRRGMFKAVFAACSVGSLTSLTTGSKTAYSLSSGGYAIREMTVAQMAGDGVPVADYLFEIYREPIILRSHDASQRLTTEQVAKIFDVPEHVL